MTIPYRTQQILKRTLLVLLVIGVVLAIISAIWFVWLQRYVIFDRDSGIRFDFSLESIPRGEQIQAPPEQPTIPIDYLTEEDLKGASTELVQMIGYYIEPEELSDIASVKSQLADLPAGTPVMLDVKNIYGDFFYSSKINSQRPTGMDTKAVDELITYLNDRKLYAIARIPALHDYYFGLHHVSDGLPMPGGYLWADEFYCYWLDPTSEGTITYLVQIITELKSLGFDEVVFSDFRFPDTDEIVFTQDKNQAIIDAAKTLVTSCATDTFAVSFIGQDVAFPLPEGRSRLYLTGVDAAQAATIAQQAAVTDPAINLVFLTDVHDTRFDVYSVLRPLSAAH